MSTRIFVWLAVLGLATLACGLLPAGSDTVAQPPAADVLFQDDFSDPTSGWDRVNVAEGVTDYQDGKYRILVNLDNTDVWANPGLNFEDVIIEVEATKAGGPDDNSFGVLCRYQGIDNYYFFYLSSDGYYGIGKVLNGEQMLIGMDSLLPSDAIHTGTATNIIRAECVDNRLTLFANGVQLGEATDDSFKDGDVGLVAGTYNDIGVDILFDNFVVRKP